MNTLPSRNFLGGRQLILNDAHQPNWWQQIPRSTRDLTLLGKLPIQCQYSRNISIRSFEMVLIIMISPTSKYTRTVYLFSLHNIRSWISGQWQSCSRSCGGGVMKRYVYCMERLSNSSFVNLDNERCTARKLITEKPCNIHPCPSWHAGQWSPVRIYSFIGF